MSEIKMLAQSVAIMGDNAMLTSGQLMVLTCAVASLVKTHPDHAAFAAEFRRAWQLAGSQHSNDALDPQTQDGIGEVLEMLEEACPVPLGVRPGR